MMLLIQCFIACAVFTLLVLPRQYKNPIKFIMSYPPKIRERVRQLPQYKDSILEDEKKHVAVKIGAVIVFAVILSGVAYLSGKKDFVGAFIHVFIIFAAVNIYDMVVIDLGIFCHSRKLRISGTEDMDEEYRNPWHHVIGACKGVLIGSLISLISAGIISFIGFLQ